ncbi:TPA: hypothetical protein KOS69_003657 [Clostridioides difficile]|nr:hypothetical protein [Clostridioides difficile]MBG0257306.1 hypothetical protein [Clostridioides difficile]MCA0551410.1 hypothetical protein [Clostridioides difficile]MDM9941686.1 hypothetical protein [Clostridioides difficile]MDV9292163.1 hypothetical protein [Clostridioides difficile]WAK48008.1 Hypothetical protein pJMR5-4_0007 [Clostridioides difficile]
MNIFNCSIIHLKIFKLIPQLYNEGGRHIDDKYDDDDDRYYNDIDYRYDEDDDRYDD